MLKETDRFTCVDDSGNSYVVVERRAVVTSTNLHGQKNSHLTSYDYKLATGEDVNKISDTIYETLISSIRLTRT